MVFVCHRTVSMAVVYQLMVKYDQVKLGVVFLDTKHPVNFLLEDKHVVNEHHVVLKSHDVTQKKCCHMVHFNVPCDRFERNLRHQKRYSEGSKKICWCPSLLGRVITHYY